MESSIHVNNSVLQLDQLLVVPLCSKTIEWYFLSMYCFCVLFLYSYLFFLVLWTYSSSLKLGREPLPYIRGPKDKEPLATQPSTSAWSTKWPPKGQTIARTWEKNTMPSSLAMKFCLCLLSWRQWLQGISPCWQPTSR